MANGRSKRANENVRTQDPELLDQLLGQYPCIPKVFQDAELDFSAQGQVVPKNNIVVAKTLNISVQRMDEILTYRSLLNLYCPWQRSGGLEFYDVHFYSTWEYDEESKSTSGRLIGNSIENQKSDRPFYKTVFDLLSKNTDTITHLVHLRDRRWRSMRCNKSNSYEWYFDRQIVVYNLPEGGLEKMLQERDLLTNVRLDTSELRNLEDVPQYLNLQIELTRQVTLLQERMWRASNMGNVISDAIRSGDLLGIPSDKANDDHGSSEGSINGCWQWKTSNGVVISFAVISGKVGKEVLIKLRLDQGVDNEEYILLEKGNPSSLLELKEIRAKLPTVCGIVNRVSQVMESVGTIIAVQQLFRYFPEVQHISQL